MRLCRVVRPEGVVEVWLTSEDLGAYGQDIGVTLPQLLWQLVRVIPEQCMLRLGMTNPPYILDHMEVIHIHTHKHTPHPLSSIPCRTWRPS